MTIVETLVIALALSLDASAVSLAASSCGYVRDRRATFRLSFHFGLFQFLMPILGWMLGSTIAPYIDRFDHWIAFALLVFVAARMLRASGCNTPAHQQANPTRGLTLVMLSTATSIDALAVGLSLAMLGLSVWFPSAVIGLVTALVCVIAIHLGAGLGAWLGNRAQIVGGIALILIAVRIVLTHTV
jgi:putative Mn2+ efflux pump MntP